MAVVSLVSYGCKDTVANLRVLLAAAMRGELRGMFMVYRTASGVEETILTGCYRANPSSAANASLKASLKLLAGNADT